jgi:hypothetical protein
MRAPDQQQGAQLRRGSRRGVGIGGCALRHGSGILVCAEKNARAPGGEARGRGLQTTPVWGMLAPPATTQQADVQMRMIGAAALASMPSRSRAHP